MRDKEEILREFDLDGTHDPFSHMDKDLPPEKIKERLSHGERQNRLLLEVLLDLRDAVRGKVEML